MNALRESAIAASDWARAAAHRRTLRGELEAAIQEAIELLNEIDCCEDFEDEQAV